MTRDPGWRFLSIGRRLERLQGLCTTLKQTLAGPAEMDLTWLLRLADSIITYRARYMARPEWLPVLDLLIRDEANPRSVAFQVHGLRDYAQRLVDLFGDFGDEHFHGALTRAAADRSRGRAAAGQRAAARPPRRLAGRRLPARRAAQPALLQPRRRGQLADLRTT